MTDPRLPSDPGPLGEEDITGVDSTPDGIDGSGAGLVLGELSTAGSGNATFTGLEDPSGPAAFYTHSGTPCG